MTIEQNDINQTRRELIKKGAKSALLLPFIGSAFASSPKHIDVAVVGAGLAGLTFGYKMRRNHLNLSVFESNFSRFGGRVQTKFDLNSDKQHAELGGERIHKSHKNILSLCNELDLELRQLDSAQLIEKDTFYCSNKKIYSDELIQCVKILIKSINRDLQGRPRDEYRNIIWPSYKNPGNWKDLDNVSTAEYLEKFDKDLPKWFITLILKAQAATFGLEAAEQSCINFLSVFPKKIQYDYFSIWQCSDESLTIKNGNKKLIDKLYEKLNAPLWSGYNLVAIVDKGTYFILEFLNPAQQTVIVKANRVVLAIPLSKLRELDSLQRLDINPAKKSAILEFGMGTNAKVIMNFNKRFWLQPSQNAMIINKRMGSDKLGGVFWETTRGQEGECGALTSFFGGKLGAVPNGNYPTECLNFYNEVWPNVASHLSGSVLAKYWIEDPSAKGSYSCAKPGQNVSYLGAFEEPELNDRLHFIGEHVSIENYGYMEGACESAIRCANRFL